MASPTTQRAPAKVAVLSMLVEALHTVVPGLFVLCGAGVEVEESRGYLYVDSFIKPVRSLKSTSKQLSGWLSAYYHL
jgi:hypothetical protein